MNNIGTSNSKEWYRDWFDSSYYHILYKHRDHSEAERFINNLNAYLNPKADSKLLDAACGKGRHALFMANLGYTVDGFDLSPNNVKKARAFENEKLKFYVNDIRKPLKNDHYDYVFNLFTSFGYFDSTKENEDTLKALAGNLNDQGVLILDYMNCAKIIESLPQSETVVVQGITFNITKKVQDDKIIKEISFEDQGRAFCYTEQVKIIYKSEFETYFKNAKLHIEKVFGDYELSTFDELNSDRLIVVARKL